MRKIVIIFTLIAGNSSAQITIEQLSSNLLRRMVMQSDVIFASSRYQTIHEYVNDYSLTHFYIAERIDSLITDKTQFKIGDRIKIQNEIDDYSFFWNDTAKSISALYGGVGKDVETYYSDLFFLKKEGKQYNLLGKVTDIEWNKIKTYYIPIIRQIEKINQTTDLNKRYAQTIDWYIAQNDYPDDNFIEFYRQKKLIGDTLILSNEQLQKAKNGFLEGNEKLSPFIADKFPLEIKEYYLKKLRKIRKTECLGYREYYDFDNIIQEMYDYHGYDIDYVMSSLLCNDNVDKYDKQTIMDYFIRKVEEEIKSLKNSQ